jgi:hypothetical protein
MSLAFIALAAKARGMVAEINTPFGTLIEKETISTQLKNLLP